jgi:hypothetical protein
LAQGEVLKGELTMAADEEGEEPEEVEYEGDHERRLWPDGASESITCRADEALARDRSQRAIIELGFLPGRSSPINRLPPGEMLAKGPP